MSPLDLFFLFSLGFPFPEAKNWVLPLPNNVNTSLLWRPYNKGSKTFDSEKWNFCKEFHPNSFNIWTKLKILLRLCKYEEIFHISYLCVSFPFPPLVPPIKWSQTFPIKVKIDIKNQLIWREGHPGGCLESHYLYPRNVHRYI